VNLTDMSDILTLDAHITGRSPDEETAVAWLLILADIPAEDAADAIRAHYQADRRWIMPADIVAHHEKLEADRVVERARQAPPQCWGCPQAYVLSARPGSKFALPAGPHDPGCRAMQGVLMFDADGGWGVMQLDPGAFDEELWEQTHLAVATRRQAYLELHTGYKELDC
jgi:hypothetical protein